MKNKLYTLLKIYLGFVGIFALQKPLFMLYHSDLYGKDSLLEWIGVIYNGLTLDFSMAGYLTVIPVLLTLASLWKEGKWLRKALNGYFITINLVIAVIFISDLELYSYWGFRLDATPLFYLKSPKNAIASVPMVMMIVMPLLMLLTWYVLNKLMKRTTDESDPKETDLLKRIINSVGLVLVLGILFIPIRGGFTVSTMNIGKVYHSANMLLNHAAINPMFSLMTSLTKEGDFASQYRFMENQEAEQVFSSLVDTRLPVEEERLLKQTQPNVILIVLESFSAKIIEPLGGIAGVAPTMNRLYREGIGFTNFYANSFRTDRGLVSILSGYPAQPSTSIMKYPAKTQSLPSISASLKKNGYDLEFLYGGDADFTNMRSYFRSAGFDRITADTDFPVSDRMTKWGVNDEKTFRYLSESLKTASDRPFMKMFLTLSSHEPFDVPTRKFDEPYLNSVAYTDSCLGVFIDELKASSLWENTLVVLLPDHAMHYPANISISEPGRYHIPMIWTGGAVKEARQIDVYGSQIDLAATLLHQMNLPHEDFKFSKDMMNDTNPRFAYYTFKDGFGILQDSATFIYDCESERAIIREKRADEQVEKQGKAFLQCLYNDLDKR